MINLNFANKLFICTPLMHAFKRSISSKTLRASIGLEVKKPAPFPYKEKNYSLLDSLIDHTTKRFDENTKLIVLEGPVGIGKTEIGKQLADELGMHFMPDVTMDSYYINNYGYDMRKLDSQLPVNCQSFDEQNFLQSPNHYNAAAFQIIKFKLRYAHYIDAIAHVLNTGDGVIIERSPFSDFVFLEAMYKCKYVSKMVYKIYYTLYRHAMPDLLHPNLVIYLDVPVSKILEQIKKRNQPNEVNSKAMNAEYLECMEDQFKSKFLRDINLKSEVLVYDWSEGGDADIIVEDIERIDFDNYTNDDPKIQDWNYSREQYWADVRMKYTNCKEDLIANFNVPVFDAPELNIPGEEVETLTHAWFNAEGNTHEEGFNPKYHKLSEIMFKTRETKKWDPVS
ncbi:NADH dehydrogenase [ubiquinone] 1 alpha subcomplex subunit 10, mitochondrial [Daktulosphaira vitifoliae]|uniref:NADH dehydrogenase [ubiquinone] 1 alpha subcomplex subunit 10, mitochondrial n=1 Tax=Daktulosphaira vitifoliae TaxID=58002 RepID=UPI0021AA5825|nr:NADH dehydrogenase [ubiquinone] 1 alpha subcomplex subunit 10, mitochondrial [Daktulosphaira vitifoliae]